MQTIKDFLYQITRSSSDPKKMSIMVIGFITGLATVAVKFAPVVCSLGMVCVNPDSIVPFANELVSVIENVAGGAAMLMVAYGGIRKMINERWSHPDVGV